MAALCRNYTFAVEMARSRIELFLNDLGFIVVPIGEAEYAVAAGAYARFGKGRHPAALNMGDCFSYACARTNQARLLFKGDDFARTDIAAA